MTHDSGGMDTAQSTHSFAWTDISIWKTGRRFLDGRLGQGPLHHPGMASTAEACTLACIAHSPARLVPRSPQRRFLWDSIQWNKGIGTRDQVCNRGF
jgi:hypothetical protein